LNLLTLALLSCIPQSAEAPKIHSVCDISQSFTFYMDGRFHTQYLKEVGRDARNWGSLEKLELSNVNLLVLTGGDPRVPYTAAAMKRVKAFAQSGGGVVLMLDGADPMPPGVALAEAFGARVTRTAAKRPLRGKEAEEISFRSGTVLDLDTAWTVLVRDAEDHPVLAKRAHGLGSVLVGSRGLFGQRPDASDPINAAWITPLLVECAQAKSIDPKSPHSSTWAELSKQVGPLTLEYHLGTANFADRIAEEYLAIRPHLVAITGVEPAPGMIKKLLILPTGGGGFSSGERIAIGAWWGNYPEQRYPMVELIGHEAGHSWVLPHPEPLWNEPIATWLGIQVGRRMKMPEADEALTRQIAKARALDPEFDALDPLAADAPRDLVWGKSFFVFEDLERRFGPGAMAKYFRTKRALVAAGRSRYTMDDCVAVWCEATGEDLFPWFRSLAFDVDAARSDFSKR